MAKVFIDGREFRVEGDKSLLEVCLEQGIDLPYFCWHPELGSVGSCRQCAVKQYRDENDTDGKIVMACMTPAKDGTRISVADEASAEMRRTVIEWLMTNHPHDCPVCEEGGECHLQDMTVMTGHVYRRDRAPKRTFRNQDLGPFIGHEMNRCITCYRCVRFYHDYAGGQDLHALGGAEHVYFGRLEDGTLESPFSGNLVEVCPTGVFTDKTFSRRYSRKWDLESAPSVCVHCAVGCNTQPGARYGELRRIMNRYNHAVNGYFLCDRGRFGYDFVNRESRLARPMARGADGLKIAPADDALAALRECLKQGRALGIGSPRASLQANAALRTAVGPERFFAGLSERDAELTRLALRILEDGPAPAATRTDIEAAADAMVEPWKAIAVEQASGGARSPVFILTPDATDLDDVASMTFRMAPVDIARLGFAIAYRIDPTAPGVEGLPDAQREWVERIAETLRQARRPLILSGTGCAAPEIMQAAANVAWALAAEGRNHNHDQGQAREARIWLSVPECNSQGLALLEAPPLEDAFAMLDDGRADSLVILENDLYRRAPKERVDTALRGAAQVFVIDHLRHRTADRAHWILPAATFAESDGVLVNAEGRAQRSYKVLPPPDEVRESWRWLVEAAEGRGEPVPSSFEALTSGLAAEIPRLAAIGGLAEVDAGRGGLRIPRATPRYSGRTAMQADQHVKEGAPPADPESPFVFSMEGGAERVPGGLAPWYWSPGWNSNEAVNRFQQEIPGPLRDAHPGVRLVMHRPGAPRFFREPPSVFEPSDGRWLFLPIHHCFGSEELSAQSPPVAERVPAPYVGLGALDADRLGLANGQTAELRIGSKVWRLPLQVRTEMAAGVVGLPLGLSCLTGVELPAWGEIRAAWGRGESDAAA